MLRKVGRCSVALVLLLHCSALLSSPTAETPACSDIRTSYNPAAALRSDTFTLTPGNPRWSAFLAWAKAKKIYTFQLVGLGQELNRETRKDAPPGIIFRWAKDTAWQKDVVVPFGQALGHMIVERRWRDTDFPVFFSSRGGIFSVDLAERLSGLDAQTLRPWQEFFQSVTAPKSPALPLLNARLLSIASDGQSASIALGQDRTTIYLADRLRSDLSSFLTDCAVAAFFREYDRSPAAPHDEAAEQPARPERGKAIYAGQCSGCHGVAGDGQGTLALNWLPRPRDFVHGSFRYRSTPTGSPPTDADLFRIVSKGLSGSGMPAFEAILSDQERQEVVAYIKQFSKRFAPESGTPPTPVSAPPQVTRKRIARGASVYVDSGCPSCHGAEGRGDGRSGQELKTSEGDPIIPRDLTHKWSFRGGHTPGDIYRRIANGMDGSSMAAYEEVLEPNDLWDLVFYVLSLSPEQRPQADAGH